MKIQATIIKIAEVDCGACPEFIKWVRENFQQDYTDNTASLSEHLYNTGDIVEQAIDFDVPAWADTILNDIFKLNCTYFRLVLN